MADAEQSPRRSVIVGAGASFPYGLPLAGKLLTDARNQVLELDRRRAEHRGGYHPHDEEIARHNDWDLAVLKSIVPPNSLQAVAQSFRDDLVQANLDDFVRDNPSLTPVVSMLITVALISSMYRQEAGIWTLIPNLRKAGAAFDKDWMRRFVGLVRPNATAENKISIISFNYDSLLERSMNMYWLGAERKYTSFADGIEFVYPHGKFSNLPERINDPQPFLIEQAAQLRLGENRDQQSRDRAREIIAASQRIYSVGFSFSPDNVELLGLSKQQREVLFVQNFGNEIGVQRTLEKFKVEPSHWDHRDMDSLVTNGFFRQ